MLRKLSESDVGLYQLTTGEPITSLASYPSPREEYHRAFEDRGQEFLHFYSVEKGEIRKHSLSRGEFWDLAGSVASYLSRQGLVKGDRILHCFSANSLYDMVFRLAAIMTGCIPVTVNWQADVNELVIYKAVVTMAKAVVYDHGFAPRMKEMRPTLAGQLFLEAERVVEYRASDLPSFTPLSYDDESMVIFTSGTTSQPKGVSLPHRSYLANRLTFEQYFGMTPKTRLDLLLVNPLHHANSSALSDWGLRRRGTIIHLVERYTTAFWQILVEVAKRKRDLTVTSLVSRHIDFLETLSAESKLPIPEADIRRALNQTDILIGSAPVGPTTVKRILRFSGRLPYIRFGSTETCLQVMATPMGWPEDSLMRAFEAGWSHRYQREEATGYYIGREHSPFTRVSLVRAIDPDSQEYFHPCHVGEPGYLITQGANLMAGYVGDAGDTGTVFREGWYTGLRDIAFALRNKEDGQLDYYWMSRDSEMLIRGGANYAYDQVAAELSEFVAEQFQLKREQFQLAVIGLHLGSEHEDNCCVTVELKPEVSYLAPGIQTGFVHKAARAVSKGSRPDYVRLAQIPRNFKGAIIYQQLKGEYLEAIRHRGTTTL